MNCGNTFDGAYCNACGQKASTHRFSVKHVLHDLPHSVWHLDRGVVKNLRGMLNPRRTVQDYIDGKRVGFFNPFFFWLLTIGLIIFVESKLEKHINLGLTLEVDGNLYDVGIILERYVNYYFFVFVFLYALPNLWLLRRNTGYNYAENVVATTFVMGYANVGYLLLLPFPPVFGYPASGYYLALVVLFSVLVFFRRNNWWTLFKIALSLVIQVLLVLVANILIGYAYAYYRWLTD